MENISPGETPEYFVFDICDTLFYSNTTFDFIKYVIDKKKWSWKAIQLSLFTKKKSPVFLGLYFLQRITGQDWPKKMSLQLLKGLDKQELLRLGEVFETEYLSSRRIEQIHKILAEFKKTGKPIVLLSASIDPVVAGIAKILGVDYQSTELEYDAGGRFTGKLKREMTGQKLSALLEMLPAPSTRFGVATDNFSDRKLVEAACHRYVVVYHEKDLEFWRDLDPHFIKLNS